MENPARDCPTCYTTGKEKAKVEEENFRETKNALWSGYQSGLITNKVLYSFYTLTLLSWNGFSLPSSE